MNANVPQAQPGLVLRDIHLPPTPSWWPPAPGWWVLAAILCAAAAVAYLAWRRAQRRRAWRTQVLAEIQVLALRHADDDAVYAAALHQLLRRAARRYDHDAPTAQGKRWREVLARVPVDDATLETLMTLETRMYQAHAGFDRARTEAAVHRWLDTALRRATHVTGEPRRA